MEMSWATCPLSCPRNGSTCRIVRTKNPATGFICTVPVEDTGRSKKIWKLELMNILRCGLSKIGGGTTGTRLTVASLHTTSECVIEFLAQTGNADRHRTSWRHLSFAQSHAAALCNPPAHSVLRLLCRLHLSRLLREPTRTIRSAGSTRALGPEDTDIVSQGRVYLLARFS